MRSTDDVMYILYRRRNWGQKDIALLFDCNVSTVCRHIQSAAINRGEVIPQMMMYNVGTEDKPRILTGRPLMVELYINREMTTPEIAEVLFCSHMTVIRMLEKLNIKRRNRLNNLMNKNEICCSSEKNTGGKRKNEHRKKIYVSKGTSNRTRN